MQKAVLDPKKRCRVCGCCVRACPDALLRLGMEAVIISPECKGCGTCTKACPFHVIILKDEAEHES